MVDTFIYLRMLRDVLAQGPTRVLLTFHDGHSCPQLNKGNEGTNTCKFGAQAGSGLRAAPTVDICSEASGFLRFPGSRIVSLQRYGVVKNRIDNRPSSLYNIRANEKQFVPVYGIR
jgi:hypothetical protein